MPSLPTCRCADLAAQIAAQRVAIARFEAALWQNGFNAALLEAYQSAWRRLEALIAAAGEDNRHRFVIVIPVADSPLHLQDCLASLLDLCRAYAYGGQAEGRWAKVSVLLADDSSVPVNIAKNRAIATSFERQGLAIQYFGLDEQIALLDRLGALDLGAIVGCHPRTAFAHKGQAMLRNIAYLKLAEMFRGSTEPRLYYTLDADQEFKVKVATESGGQEVLAVNFLYRLDEIFSASDAQVLTGKVVGDPPVSPAVMAGNFLEDVIGFLREMAAADPMGDYRQPAVSASGDAAYHDMADLFGFKPAADAQRYRCPLDGVPGNAACFAAFSQRLHSFFHGEHPTRITWFEYQDAPAAAPLGTHPARTVYTGNYVFRPEALRWFIPYAPLRLRMSGPTMGRLLQAEMGQHFVSANLPMLHKRALAGSGQSEFRPGVVAERSRIDLCGEFERQFHGDVMLFSMQRLIALGYPERLPEVAEVAEILDEVRAEMREKYRLKQAAILDRLALLETLLADPARWWNQDAASLAARTHFQDFAANLERNFGVDSPCYARIDAPGNWASWRARQLAAIQSLPADRQDWAAALQTLGA